jgi:hypothetical protein
MLRLRMIIAVAALVASMTAFAACNGGDDNDNNGGGPPVGATAGTGSDPGESGNGDSGDVDELSAIAERFADSTFQGQYRVIPAPGDEDIGDATLAIYKSGADRVRMEIAAEQDGVPTEIILLQTPSASAFCLKNAGEFGALLGIAEGEGVCFNSDPTEGDATGDYSQIIEDIESGNGQIVERSERQIAGQDAKCYRIQEPGGDVTDACFNDDGYLLASTGPDGSGLEATSVSGDVSDTDFDVPYEVREFPTFDQ